MPAHLCRGRLWTTQVVRREVGMPQRLRVFAGGLCTASPWRSREAAGPLSASGTSSRGVVGDSLNQEARLAGRLEGRTALVTGASRGLGRAIALKLAAEGAQVALNYRTGEAQARQVADEIASRGGTTLLIRADVSLKDEARAMVAKVAPPVREQILAKIPMGRFGRPEEIANAVAFLCAEGDYITGQQINVNGGVYM